MIHTTVNVDPLVARMARYRRRFNRSQVLKLIGMRQLSWITRNFDDAGEAVGGWPPNSPNTIAAKGSSAPLQDTGHLKQSFVRGGEGNLFIVEGDRVTVGTNVQYAEAHEKGVPADRINPILPTTQREQIGTDYRGRRIFRGGVLAFMTARGMVFARYVKNHPGIPQRRMLPNEAEARALAVQVIEGMIKKLDEKESASGEG